MPDAVSGEGFGQVHTAQEVWFVIRLKDAAVYAVVEDRRIQAPAGATASA